MSARYFSSKATVARSISSKIIHRNEIFCNVRSKASDFFTIPKSPNICFRDYHASHLLPSASTSDDKKYSVISNDDILGASFNMSSLPASALKKISQTHERHKVILHKLQSDEKNAEQLGKELSSLSQVASLYSNLLSLNEEITSLTELAFDAAESRDHRFAEECEEEIATLQSKIPSIEESLIDSILPKDENDAPVVGCLIEIRSASGGDESSLFANTLFDSYSRTAKLMGFSVEIMDLNETEIGGVREVVLSVTSGNGGYNSDSSGLDIKQFGPYGYFKYESGVHRVQRVPVNDVRIQTSTASVAVLPQSSVNSQNSAIPPSDLKIEVMRSSGAGGQHVNTTESAVRITHIPTKISASIQDERSQHKNKAKAMKLIETRVLAFYKEEEDRTLGETKRGLMGGGTRSERIRTYNYPQDRISDHRCKQTMHGIDSLLMGSAETGLVWTFAPHLRKLHRDELIKDMEGDKIENDDDESGKGRKKRKK